MPGTRRGNNDSIALRMEVDNEMRVRRHSIKTIHRRLASIRKPGQSPSYVVRVRGLFFYLADCSILSVWSRDHVVLFTRQFNRFSIKRRKSIESKTLARLEDPDENWKLSR